MGDPLPPGPDRITEAVPGTNPYQDRVVQTAAADAEESASAPNALPSWL